MDLSCRLRTQSLTNIGRWQRRSLERRKNSAALGSLEAIGDGLEHGKVTDFYRAVQADEDENVVLSFILWPDKATRDSAWEEIMGDPEMQPSGEMPFDGKRMFWGGFKPFVNTLEN